MSLVDRFKFNNSIVELAVQSYLRLFLRLVLSFMMFPVVLIFVCNRLIAYLNLRRFNQTLAAYDKTVFSIILAASTTCSFVITNGGARRILSS